MMYGFTQNFYKHNGFYHDLTADNHQVCMNAGVEGSDVTGASGDNISEFPP